DARRFLLELAADVCGAPYDRAWRDGVVLRGIDRSFGFANLVVQIPVRADRADRLTDDDCLPLLHSDLAKVGIDRVEAVGVRNRHDLAVAANFSRVDDVAPERCYHRIAGARCDVAALVIRARSIAVGADDGSRGRPDHL